MFVGFHYAKILPHCNGCYISGSGQDDAVIETEGFRKRILISFLIESHYYRSKQSMLMIVKVTDTLIWEVFFLAIDTRINDDLIQLQVLLGEKNAELARTAFL